MPRKPVKNPFSSRQAEIGYANKLRDVAKQVTKLVDGYYARHPGDVIGRVPGLAKLLREYGRLVEPWARSAAQSMLDEVERRDRAGWARVSREMTRHLAREIEGMPVGEVMTELLRDQVDLITSLPLEAAERVQRLSVEAMLAGSRGSEIEAAILRTGEVTAGRAKVIARTEVARASSVLIEARSRGIGSEGYIWRIVDNHARPDHKLLNGKYFKWSAPPIADRRTGARAHPGCIWNCRCFPEPVIPDHL